MPKIIHYYRCEACGQECREVDCKVDAYYFDPTKYDGVGCDVVDGVESDCCHAPTYPCQTLPLSKEGQERLLKRWNRIGNAEIIKHIEEVLPYIGRD